MVHSGKGALQFGPTQVALLKGNGVVMGVACPIYDPGHLFEGEIASSIKLPVLGALVRNETAPQFRGDLSLIDQNATILYSTYNDGALIGENIFSNEVLVLLPSNEKTVYIQQWQGTVSFNAPGIANTSASGMAQVAAHNPILVSFPVGNSSSQISSSERIGTIVVSTPLALPAAQAAQITRLQDFSSLTIAGIGGGAVIGASILLRWNRRLDELVNERTRGLAEGSEQFLESRNDLLRANKDLADRDKAQRDFLNIAVHELRTPVQPLLTISEIMEDTAKNVGKVTLSQEEIDMIERSARRLDRLTRTVLDLGQN